ncbi:segregation and condensation protein A [Mobilicoccus caccae]|uniref:Segregation and condensation protein A n=1 Tax=Mobilicoccus caccae TaxID=1859295 RepID=A0ABQ6IQU7_9MICO|nr:ScpA family protein [Mobilicoccus caccae]GMA39643.1 segregation/condensation protein A [Mobilicoccus caccae]
MAEPREVVGGGADQVRPGAAPGGVITRRAAVQPFEVHLEVFSGPFDLLLGLIAKHRLDLTEIALAKVTDEFIAHIRAQQAADAEWDLSQASEFVLVAATLLDLKAARLLPSLDPEEEDLELIEARDLLFARLLQYRAFKDVAAWCEHRMETAGRIVARQAELEPQFAALLPELVLGITPEHLAMIAADALTRTPPQVGVEHLHRPLVSVREQAQIVVSRLRAGRRVAFRDLVADADSTLVIVARFLSLLDLFREAAVVFDQPEALGDLTVEWTGTEVGEIEAGADFDEEDTTTPAGSEEER